MMLSTGIYNARIFKEAFWRSTNPGLLVRLGVTFVRFHQNIGKLHHSTQCNKFQIKVFLQSGRRKFLVKYVYNCQIKIFIASVSCNCTLKSISFCVIETIYDCNIIIISTKLTIILIITGWPVFWGAVYHADFSWPRPVCCHHYSSRYCGSLHHHRYIAHVWVKCHCDTE